MSGGLGSRTTAPLLGIENFGDGKRSWPAYAKYLEARCVRAEEALQETYWLLRADPDNALHALDAWIIKNGHGDWLAAVPEEDTT